MRARRVALLVATASTSVALQAPRQPRTPTQRQPTTTRRVATLEPPHNEEAAPPQAHKSGTNKRLREARWDIDVIPSKRKLAHELKPRQRVIGLAYISACTIVASARIPAFFRLLGLQYAVLSVLSVLFSLWCMHATYGTWRDKIFLGVESLARATSGWILRATRRWSRLQLERHRRPF